MYRLQNLTPGSLPIDLEHGSIILMSGNSFDLDTVCSRKWIAENPTLLKLTNLGAVRVIHDSEVSLGNAPVTSAIAEEPVVDRTVPPLAGAPKVFQLLPETEEQIAKAVVLPPPVIVIDVPSPAVPSDPVEKALNNPSKKKNKKR